MFTFNSVYEHIAGATSKIGFDEGWPLRKREIEPDRESDDEDLAEFIPLGGKKHDPFWYAQQCENLANQNKLVECVAMLEKRMIKEDRVYPVFGNFSVVIKALGRAGYCTKAFEMFTLMRRKGIEPKKYIYTSLWNACANSHNSKLAIEKAEWLLEKLDRESFMLERAQYHTLIKVFGRHGKPEAAFKVVDRMIREGFRPDAETYAHLLQGCISDRTAGFKLAIELLDLIPSNLKSENALLSYMEWFKCQPDVDFFNLMIRKRCLRNDREQALELLSKFQEHGFQPTVRTFGCLTLNCKKRADGLNLLQDMKALGMKPNFAILTSLVANALRFKNFWYALDLLKTMREQEIMPDERLIKYIERHLEYSRQLLRATEINSEDSYLNSEYCRAGYAEFMRYYNKWLKTTPVSKEINPEEKLAREVEAFDADNLRKPWEKPWEFQQPKYE